MGAGVVSISDAVGEVEDAAEDHGSVGLGDAADEEGAQALEVGGDGGLAQGPQVLAVETFRT
ncbi:hypothetical protein GCM10018779_32940 [Streptomyces griseocarneus]|nr:hypothetical protein GCM10018779_32940 [Streptomyces griseocarneus]